MLALFSNANAYLLFNSQNYSSIIYLPLHVSVVEENAVAELEGYSYIAPQKGLWQTLQHCESKGLDLYQ